MGEKRKLERFALHVPARLSYRRNRGSEVTLDVHTRDISAEGAYIYLPERELAVGTTVGVELVLTFEKLKKILETDERVTVRVDGKVVREEPEGIVVAFMHSFRFAPV